MGTVDSKLCGIFIAFSGFFYLNKFIENSRIQSGMYHQAKRVAETMIVSNCDAPNSPILETESHVRSWNFDLKKTEKISIFHHKT